MNRQYILSFLLLLIVLSTSNAQQKPCKQYPIFRQLDFWIGKWRVENPDGTLAGHNDIEVILDGCVIKENWTGNGPNRGKSFNYYNFQTKKWHQQWVDNFGQTLLFEGEVKDNAMHYTGTSLELSGKKVYHQLTLSKVSEVEVRQLWKQSYDQKKWTAAFDGKYIRVDQRQKMIPKENQILAEKLNTYLQAFIEHDLFSGVILIAKNEQILLQQAYGMANEEWAVPNALDTKFRIASLSKAFTKLAIRQLSETKQLKYTDPISRYIVGYPNGAQITLQQLIDHTSGIPHLNDFPAYDQWAKQTYTLEELVKLFRDQPLDFTPGTQTSYSNSAYVLLAYIIEKVSGLTYGDYLQKHIFAPAGMQNTAHEKYGPIIKNKAEGYMQNLQGKGRQRVLYYDPSIKTGGGSIYSTVKDLFLFDQAFRQGRLSQSAAPLYNEGLFGKSPGFNAAIWGNGTHFVCLLSNNYHMPMNKIGRDIVKMALGQEYSHLDIQATALPDSAVLADFVGDYQIDDDLISIRHQKDALIIFENHDPGRANRLIPIGEDTFFDPQYLEKVVFERNDQGMVDHFLWIGDQSTSKASRIPIENE